MKHLAFRLLVSLFTFVIGIALSALFPTGRHHVTVAGRQRRVAGIKLAGHVEAVGPGHRRRAGEDAKGRRDVLRGEGRDQRRADGRALPTGGEADGVPVEHDAAADRARNSIAASGRAGASRP